MIFFPFGSVRIMWSANMPLKQVWVSLTLIGWLFDAKKCWTEFMYSIKATQDGNFIQADLNFNWVYLNGTRIFLSTAQSFPIFLPGEIDQSTFHLEQNVSWRAEIKKWRSDSPVYWFWRQHKIFFQLANYFIFDCPCHHYGLQYCQFLTRVRNT